MQKRYKFSSYFVLSAALATGASLAACTNLAAALSELEKRGELADGGADGGPAASDGGAAGLPPSLKVIPVPGPADLNEYIVDKTAAVVLGKALFWDMQVGSDGVQACASCHSHAGTDNRSKNALNPRQNAVNADGNPAKHGFDLPGANYQLTKNDFPLYKLTDPNDRTSKVVRNTRDVVGPQGVINKAFLNVVPGNAQDNAAVVADPDGFSVGGINTRRVEPRNAPSVYNAVFNFRNFWDGRAQNEFNGVNPFGDRDPNATVLRVAARGDVQQVHISIKNSSLASQTTAPPVAQSEMSALGRTGADIGHKFSGGPAMGSTPQGADPQTVMALRPLGKQLVNTDDSVLGAFSRAPARGLNVDSYAELIQKAFAPEWWQSDKLVQVAADGTRNILAAGQGDPNDTHTYTVAEANWALFFGLAVQAYESTLVSDDTPFDQFREGKTDALTPVQQKGMGVFFSPTGGKCVFCHGGPEFTSASVASVSAGMLSRVGGNLHDQGFFSAGVTSTLDDLGIGGKDPFGHPLSNTGLALLGQFVDPTLTPAVQPGKDIPDVDSAFKTPGLRNVELTGPYFHNGGMSTLGQVVDFYNRGGNFQPQPLSGKPIQPNLVPLGLSDDDKQALVSFLTALTDERVRYARAPFDHPQLFVANGHPGDATSVQHNDSDIAADTLVEIPGVGKNGCPVPTHNFLE